jgi:iron(III) transport system ATP-binding protein
LPHLELIGLTKRFGAVTSVAGLDLAVEPGELVCLVGPSGCGKTTTLRMIAGFLAPDAGEIRAGGRRISAPDAVVPPERRNMGMIFQGYAVWPHMTVRDNVAYGLRMRGVPAAEREARVAATLQATQLGELAGRYPAELSGGQQQRVALARALAPRPDILLLDEPLSNLDANLRGDMRLEIRRLHDELRCTSIYVTHDQVEAMTLADRIVVMNAGRVEQIGSPQEVYDRPNSKFVARFIGGSNVLDVEHVAGREVALGGHRLFVGDGEFAGPGRAMSVCVKTHDLELVTGAPPSRDNLVPGVVVRHAYLGSHRDYVVDVGQDLLIAAPATPVVAPGTPVHVRFHAERCRALAK